MKKSKFAQPGIAKTFTLTQALVDLMDKMLISPSDFGFFSYSEIVRRGIFLAYREQRPPYKDPSPAGKLKEDKVSKQMAFELMTDEDYAKSILQSPILPDENGVPHVVMHWFGNTLQAKPLDGCKEWFSTRLDIVDNHLSKCKTLPIEEAIQMPKFKEVLLRDFKITVPDNEQNQ